MRQELPERQAAGGSIGFHAPAHQPRMERTTDATVENGTTINPSQTAPPPARQGHPGSASQRVRVPAQEPGCRIAARVYGCVLSSPTRGRVKQGPRFFEERGAMRILLVADIHGNWPALQASTNL